MNKQLIDKLIEEAKVGAENAYCPLTGVAEGVALLTGENVILRSANFEGGLTVTGAGELCIMKAFSEGFNSFLAICYWSEKVLPYPQGRDLLLLGEFCPQVDIVVANDQTFNVHKLHELLPIRRVVTND